jgi:hypothetical protein
MEDSQRGEPLESNPYYLFCCSSLCEKVKLFTCTAAVHYCWSDLEYAVQLHSAIIFVVLFFGMVLLA